MARSVKGLHVILSGTVAVSWCRSIRAMVPVEVRTRSVRVNVSLDEGLLARMDAVATRLGDEPVGFAGRRGTAGHRGRVGDVRPV